MPFIQSNAGVYEYSALRGAGDYFTSAQFRIYVPDTVAIIKGVYCIIGLLNEADNEQLRKLCNETGFALMSGNIIRGPEKYHDPLIGVYKAILQALQYFAGKSLHHEIKYAPIFFEAYSAGAWVIYYFSWWKPEITLGFIAQKFAPLAFNVGDAKKVPGYIFYDLQDNLIPTTAFEINRSKGALWCLAFQVNGFHDRIYDRNLLDNYFKTVIQLRLPTNTVLLEPVQLKTINQATGWLGDNLNYFIAPYDSFMGVKSKASWFPDKEVAVKWKEFVTDTTHNGKKRKLDINPQFKNIKSNNIETIIPLNESNFQSQSILEPVASFDGEKTGDNAGYSVAAAGDVNSDGYGDFLIGAPGKDGAGLSNTNAGITYLLLGSPDNWGQNFNLINANASFIGEASGNYSGCSVASAGDVNGDGLDDFIIGARGNRDNGDNAGKTYLILGRTNADWHSGFDLSQADASFIGEKSSDWSGAHVSPAGDVNGDGLDDFLIGSEGRDIDSLNIDKGMAYLILGRTAADWGKSFNLSKSDASFIGETALDGAGYAVSSAGDVNGDGLSDFLIGTKFNFSNDASDDSKTYLILGKRSAGWGWEFNLSNADASFVGEHHFDMSGHTIAPVGDVNNDGLDDFLIGAHDNSSGEYNSGQAYLLLGRQKADWGLNFNLSQADASFIGEYAFDVSAFSMASAGDLNNDGLADFTISAPNNSSRGQFSGKTYLLLGREAADWGKQFRLSDADASLIGEGTQDLSGFYFITIPANPSLDFQEEDSFSIEYWYKSNPNGMPAQGAVGRYIPELPARYYVGMNSGDGRARFYMSGGGSSAAINGPPARITDRIWHHIAAVRNGRTKIMKLYVDGALCGSVFKIFPVDFASPTANLQIGSVPGLATLYGTLDEIAIYNRELTAEEIFSHYNLGMNGYGYCDKFKIRKDQEILSSEQLIPAETVLYQNYPNPFNASTEIKFAVSKAGRVTVKIYNQLGEEISEAVNQDFEPGIYERHFDASHLASGIYFYRMQSGSFTSVRKFILLK